MKSVVLISVLFLAGLPAHAEGFTCKRGFSPDECAALERAYTAQEEKRAAQKAATDKAVAEAEARMKADNDRRERERAERFTANEKWRAERDAQYAAQEQRRAEEDRRDEAAARQAEAVLKRRCGADYKKPRIGMTMERVRECVSDSLQQVGQAHTAQGVVTTHQSGRSYIRTLDGKVVEWGTF